MLAEALKRFAPFCNLDAAGLEAAAAQARLIELPAHRWLIRHGRGLNRHLYLVEGDVQAVDEQGRRRTVQGEIYRPGDRVAIETRSATRVISADLSALQFILNPATPPAPDVAPVEGWLDRLLASPLVRALPAITWQRLLRGAQERRLAVDERLQAQDAVYVVRSGVLERDGVRYEPGEFFGEDVAFAGEGALQGRMRAAGAEHRAGETPRPVPREEPASANAPVYVALQAAVLLQLPGAAVRELLIDYPLTAPPCAQIVDLDGIVLADLPAAARLLRRERPVAVRGGRAGQRAYALIALTRMGFTAAPAAD